MGSFPFFTAALSHMAFIHMLHDTQRSLKKLCTDDTMGTVPSMSPFSADGGGEH